jgi:hypothetical protein
LRTLLTRNDIQEYRWIHQFEQKLDHIPIVVILHLQINLKKEKY